MASDLLSWADAQPPSEEWRSIADFPAYEVSNLGRVRRRTDAIGLPPKGGDPFIIARAGTILKTEPRSGSRYPSVKLWSAGIGKHRRVHQLVCEAFHGTRPTPKHEVAHYDGDCTNNTSKNLRWALHRDNANDMVRHGTSALGVKNHNTRLTEEQVYEIRDLCAQGVPQKEIAVIFGVHHVYISKIARRIRWARLPEQEGRP